MHHSRVPDLPDRHVCAAIAVVALGRAADYLTTWVTQQPATVGEGNPVMAAGFQALGKVPTLLLAYILTVGLLVVGVEVAAALARQLPDPRVELAARAIGYGIPAVASALIVGWNLSFL